jgi:hypothetical protein
LPVTIGTAREFVGPMIAMVGEKRGAARKITVGELDQSVA